MFEKILWSEGRKVFEKNGFNFFYQIRFLRTVSQPVSLVSAISESAHPGLIRIIIIIMSLYYLPLYLPSKRVCPLRSFVRYIRISSHRSDCFFFSISIALLFTTLIIVDKKVISNILIRHECSSCYPTRYSDQSVLDARETHMPPTNGFVSI